MWKVLCAVAVIIFAVPIFCGPIEGGKNITVSQKTVNDLWSEKCKNASGVTIDLNRNDKLRTDYKSCTKAAINENDLRRDFASIFPKFDQNKTEDFHLSQQQKFDLVAMSRKYCPKVDALFGCSDIILPFHLECFNDVELEGKRVLGAIYRGLYNYFCKNDADEVKNSIDKKVIECAVEKKDQLLECFHTYGPRDITMDEMISRYRMWPSAGVVCSVVLMNFGMCLVKPFDQCASSAGEYIELLVMRLLSENSCGYHMQEDLRRRLVALVKRS